MITVCTLFVDVVQTREKRAENCRQSVQSIYDYEDYNLWGQAIHFKNFQDNILLLVNVATFCEYSTQYQGLNRLQVKYYNKERCGLKIFGIPCNQFAHKEPGNDAEEIYNGLRYVRPGNGFEPKITLLEKRDVNGNKEDPLYNWLKVRQMSGSRVQLRNDMLIEELRLIIQ